MESNSIMWCLIGVVMVMVAIDNTDACSCMFTHPQNQYCSADFVMLVTPRSEAQIIYKKEEVTTFDHDEQKTVSKIHRYPIDKTFNVRIRKIFNLKPGKSSPLVNNTKIAILHTPPEGSLCGVDMNPRIKYLVTGQVDNGQLHINLCGWVTRWILLTKSQKRNLRYSYKNNCDCTVHMRNFLPHNVNMDKTCVLNMRRHGDCYVEQSACVHSKNSPTGICKWQNHSRLKKCKADKRNGMRLP